MFGGSLCALLLIDLSIVMESLKVGQQQLRRLHRCNRTFKFVHTALSYTYTHIPKMQESNGTQPLVS